MERARRSAGAAGARATRTLQPLDKALGPDLGQCCGGRVLLTIERFDAVDSDMVAPLAEAEQRQGIVTTIATPTADGRLARRLALRRR